MIQIDNTLISLDLIEKKFVCDIAKCKGICCYEGDSGAPLTNAEVAFLTENIDKILPYLTDKGKQAVIENGVSYLDVENEEVTTLIEGKECAFALMEDGIYSCGIEKACNAGKITFKKPISCYLYPVRVAKYHNYEAVNYDSWHICNHACIKGKRENVSVMEFLKEPLIQRFGQAWYTALEEIAEEYNKQKNN